MNVVLHFCLFLLCIGSTFGYNDPWSVWTVWSGCTVTCGTGVNYRMRSCMNGYPGTPPCDGDWLEQIECGRPCGAPIIDFRQMASAGPTTSTTTTTTPMSTTTTTNATSTTMATTTTVPTTTTMTTTTTLASSASNNGRQQAHCFDPLIPDSYRGSLSHTKSGLQCQRWNSQFPHPHSHTPSQRPLSDLNNNFCRNPDMDSRPWCFTTNAFKQWEYCEPTICTEYQTPAPTPSTGNANCYDPDRPSDYRGQVSTTEGGHTCQMWTANFPHKHSYFPANFPNDDVGNHNFCRNPDKDQRPWCFTNNPHVKWGYCDIPKCTGHNGVVTLAPSANPPTVIGGGGGGASSQCGRVFVDMAAPQSMNDDDGSPILEAMDEELIVLRTNFNDIMTEDLSIRATRFDAVSPPKKSQPSSTDDEDRPDIVGGHESNPGSIPWQVSLRRTAYGSHFCGASIISKEWILTAAHCISQPNHPGTYFGIVGDHHQYSVDASEKKVDFDVIIKHDQYNPSSLQNDITLMKTSTPMTFNNRIGSVCLPPPASTLLNNQMVIVSGWGATHNTGSNSVLRQTSVPIVEPNRCRSLVSGVLPGMICAGHLQGGKDSCQGDSGGPLVQKVGQRYRLVGVVSWGYGCAQPNQPGVYTQVSYYIRWINEQMAMA